jgi:hypothetical protein
MRMRMHTCACTTGDLGCNGMGISEGKITLYTAAAGVNPMQCLPICVDIGTNNPEYLAEPDYKGIKAPRISGACLVVRAEGLPGHRVLGGLLSPAPCAAAHHGRYHTHTHARARARRCRV